MLVLWFSLRESEKKRRNGKFVGISLRTPHNRGDWYQCVLLRFIVLYKLYRIGSFPFVINYSNTYWVHENENWTHPENLFEHQIAHITLANRSIKLEKNQENQISVLYISEPINCKQRKIHCSKYLLFHSFFSFSWLQLCVLKSLLC